MIAPEAVVTFERPDGFRIVRSLGLAHGEATRPSSVWRAAMRALGALVGLSAAELRTEAEQVRSECLASLLVRAERLGANGVVGLRFDASENMDGSILVRASGEAVVLEPAPGGRAP